MISKQEAESFAQEWIESWNSHDLDAILSHYEDDFEMSSPIIIKTMAEPSGKLKGKAKITEYWTKALKAYPDLKFSLQQVLIGANSITIIYLGVPFKCMFFRILRNNSVFSDRYQFSFEHKNQDYNRISNYYKSNNIKNIHLRALVCGGYLLKYLF